MKKLHSPKITPLIIHYLFYTQKWQIRASTTQKLLYIFFMKKYCLLKTTNRKNGYLVQKSPPSRTLKEYEINQPPQRMYQPTNYTQFVYIIYYWYTGTHVYFYSKLTFNSHKRLCINLLQHIHDD